MEYLRDNDKSLPGSSISVLPDNVIVCLLCSFFSLLSSRSSLLASTRVALLALSSLFSLLSRCLLVSLLYLTLLQALSDSCAASRKDCIDRILCVVVCRDNEIYLVRISVSVNDTEYWDTETLSLLDSDLREF